MSGGGFALSSEPKPDISMMVLSAAGAKLVSRDVAEKLAAMLVESNYGKEELQRQSPFSAADGGDRWIITGSRRIGEFPAQKGYLDTGPFKIQISKSDCRILLFVREAVIGSTR